MQNILKVYFKIFGPEADFDAQAGANLKAGPRKSLHQILFPPEPRYHTTPKMAGRQVLLFSILFFSQEKK